MRKCENCRHFIDYRSKEDDPEEVNGYCGQLVDDFGLEEAVKMNGGYAGHWTHHNSSCENWKDGTTQT